MCTFCLLFCQCFVVGLGYVFVLLLMGVVVKMLLCRVVDGCCSEDVVVLLMGVVVKMLLCRVVDGCCSVDVVVLF